MLGRLISILSFSFHPAHDGRCGGRTPIRGPAPVSLESPHVRRARPLRAGSHVESDLVVLLEVSIPRTVDGAEVHEHVRPIVLRDESEPLVRVEPFHSSVCHKQSLLSWPSLHMSRIWRPSGSLTGKGTARSCTANCALHKPTASASALFPHPRAGLARPSRRRCGTVISAARCWVTLD